MHRKMLNYLVCPKTGSALDLLEKETNGERVVQGVLLSSVDDGVRYPIRGGIPRFVDLQQLENQQQKTIEAFEFKWSKIPNYAHEDKTKRNREQWFFERFGFSTGDADIQNFLMDCKFVLEAGVGTGVDSDLIARNFSGVLFGLDMSDSIEIAYERFKSRENIVLMQADVRQLPFKEAFFDVIVCDQVLHHTPDPRKSFSHLIQHLRKNGLILFYVYKQKGPVREFSDDYLRCIFTKSSLEQCLSFCRKITSLGRNLSHLKAVIEIEEDIPELSLTKGKYDVQRLIYDHIFKCFWNEDYDFDTNMMINFDWYRPIYASRFQPEDIRRWCIEEDLQIVHFDVCPSGISVIARKASK
jgi:ubiquinone/menaquinone biosynthesis C-methylase UbiE/uncharacterized protein YbaR (Trm112 family)